MPLIHLSTDYVFDGAKSDLTSRPTTTNPAERLRRVEAGGRAEQCWKPADNCCDPSHGVGLQPVRRAISSRRCCASPSIGMKSRSSPISTATQQARLISPTASCALQNNLASSQTDAELRRGIFHMTAQGEASWAEFAQAIFAQSAELGGPTATVHAHRHSRFCRRQPGAPPIRASTPPGFSRRMVSACRTGNHP